MKATDPHDREALAHVWPPGWQNPRPADRYDLVVLGGGPAGLVAAHGAAGLGARVALVERRALGGDCLVSGCVPSKALLAAAHRVRAARGAAALGLTIGGDVDGARVLAGVRAARAGLAPHDGAARLAAAGVEVFLGEGRFGGAAGVEVGGQTLRFRRALVATGAATAWPAIAGLQACGAVDAEGIFAWERLPDRLLILGAGAAGLELGQALSVLGVRVTLIERGPRLLPHLDPIAGERIAAALAADGVELRLGVEVQAVRREPGGLVVVWGGGALEGDAILVATGRRPVTAGLGLEAAGVVVGPTGIVVNDRLQTTNPRVFAAGDVVGGSTTHGADAMARIVLANALFWGRRRHQSLSIPQALFTQPEVAWVGGPVEGGQTLAMDAPLDRLVLDGAGAGAVRVHVDRRGRVVGGLWVGPRAGDLIGLIGLAKQRGMRLAALSGLIAPYPTEASALSRAGDLAQRQRLLPPVAALLRGLLQLGRWLDSEAT